MNTPITITRKIELINILVVYKEIGRPVEYPSENEFNKSLQSRPLTSISSIYIPFNLNGLCSLKLTIRLDSAINRWVVTKGNQPFFYFSFEGQEGFMDKFWYELRDMLTPPDSPGPQSKSMM